MKRLMIIILGLTAVFATVTATTFDDVWNGTGAEITTYRTDAAYPHTILAGESSTGGTGEIIASIYEPYWKLHANKDEKLRSVLGIQ